MAETSTKRPLGSSEENWTRCAAAGTGIGVFGVALNHTVDLHTVALAAQSLCENHAILRSQVTNDSNKSSSKKLSFEVRSSAVPHVESLPWPDRTAGTAGENPPILSKDSSPDGSLSRLLHKIVTDELNTPLHKADHEFPVDIFRIHVYQEPSGTAAILILRFHSGACDRYTSSVAAAQFLRLLNDLHSSVESSQDRDGVLPTMEDLIPKSKASKGILRKSLDAFAYAKNSSKSALLPFHPGFSKSSSGALRSELLTYTLGKGTPGILAACKRENTTLPAALSAALIQTAASLKEMKEKKVDTFSFTSVLDCRPYFEPPLASTVMGNYSAGLPQDQRVKEGVSFWDVAREISSVTEKSLEKSHQFSELSVLNMLLSQVIKHPGLTPNSSLRTALFTLFVDGPTKFSWDELGNLKVAGSIGPLASMHFVGPCVTLAEALVEDELYLYVVYASPVHSREQIHSYLGSALELLAASAK